MSLVREDLFSFGYANSMILVMVSFLNYFDVSSILTHVCSTCERIFWLISMSGLEACF